MPMPESDVRPPNIVLHTLAQLAVSQNLDIFFIIMRTVNSIGLQFPDVKDFLRTLHVSISPNDKGETSAPFLLQASRLMKKHMTFLWDLNDGTPDRTDGDTDTSEEAETALIVALEVSTQLLTLHRIIGTEQNYHPEFILKCRLVPRATEAIIVALALIDTFDLKRHPDPDDEDIDEEEEEEEDENDSNDDFTLVQTEDTDEEEEVDEEEALPHDHHDHATIFEDLAKETFTMLFTGWLVLADLLSVSNEDVLAAVQKQFADNQTILALLLPSLAVPCSAVHVYLFDFVTRFMSEVEAKKSDFMQEDFFVPILRIIESHSSPVIAYPMTHISFILFLKSILRPPNSFSDAQKKHYYQICRTKVFVPARSYIIFAFSNEHLLRRCFTSTSYVDDTLRKLHKRLFELEDSTDMFDNEFVVLQTKWEIEWMGELKGEETVGSRMSTILTRKQRWEEHQRERAHIRSQNLIDHGWEDALESREMGHDELTNQAILDNAPGIGVASGQNVPIG
ncbi:hypothetical protein BLNAU_22603 [Blattamonas nauphoetae]|uniref:Uncharacterized protein n=1 Tax=Blattamonas nauphoetae TaxID=2049346 RepID=A0ABQ9WUT2_9EUKA|nr:hypothetical protein BLNAU_22603 [Blattamonas nauphoetae]